MEKVLCPTHGKKFSIIVQEKHTLSLTLSLSLSLSPSILLLLFLPLSFSLFITHFLSNTGRPCALKTGTQPGTSYGHSFYMCLMNYQRQQCGFIQRAKWVVSCHVDVHEIQSNSILLQSSTNDLSCPWTSSWTKDLAQEWQAVISLHTKFI